MRLAKGKSVNIPALGCGFSRQTERGDDGGGPRKNSLLFETAYHPSRCLENTIMVPCTMSAAAACVRRIMSPWVPAGAILNYIHQLRLTVMYRPRVGGRAPIVASMHATMLRICVVRVHKCALILNNKQQVFYNAIISGSITELTDAMYGMARDDWDSDNDVEDPETGRRYT